MENCGYGLKIEMQVGRFTIRQIGKMKPISGTYPTDYARAILELVAEIAKGEGK